MDGGNRASRTDDDRVDDTQAGDTRTAIMDATYRALCTQGYADLTVAAIAGEFDKSKATIHYHYDTKDDLLAAFLDYLLDRFVDRLSADAESGPEARVTAIADALLFDMDDPDGDRDLHTALLEIRAQAPHRAAFREQLTANHTFAEDLLTEAIADGIDEGVFRAVDPRSTARLVLATMLGGRVYDLTLDDRDVAADVRTALDDVVLEPLRAPDGTGTGSSDGPGSPNGSNGSDGSYNPGDESG
ncbi:TetR family transcriptional regulator [Halobacteriales archaeon QS_8_65_32]|jgi:AcrR family transcriptional regulator|nr:MAG: TetR family transcriptional regulator [Halobacteriales archaeon QS_8_65_32]